MFATHGFIFVTHLEVSVKVVTTEPSISNVVILYLQQKLNISWLTNSSSMVSWIIYPTKYMPFFGLLVTSQLNQIPNCLGQLHHNSYSKTHYREGVHQSDVHLHHYHLHQRAFVYGRYSTSWNSFSAWTRCLQCPLSKKPSSSCDWVGGRGLLVAVVPAGMKRMMAQSSKLLWWWWWWQW